MALRFLDKNLIREYLQAMWKKELGVNKDPANGKWYENGANNDGKGLYGGLHDNAATQLILNEAQKEYLPQMVVCDSAILDNRNGLAPSSTVKMAYSYTNSASTTHSITDSIKVGAGMDIKASAKIFGIGADVTTKFTFDYTHSWGSSKTETESRTFAFEQSVALNVPAGKVYKVVLTAMSQKLIVPYSAVIAVSGTTETWLADRVKGHYNWIMDAAHALAKIGEWGLAGRDSHSYSSAGVTQFGTVTAQQTSQFVAQVFDITDTYDPSGHPPPMKRMLLRSVNSDNLAPVEGTLVQTIPFEGVGTMLPTS